MTGRVLLTARRGETVYDLHGDGGGAAFGAPDGEWLDARGPVAPRVRT
jgi:dihydroorotase